MIDLRGINIRRATENDCFDIWLWRNHPKVREVMFNTDEIAYEEHRKWFFQKLKDDNVKIYIAENENGEKLGQVRFEIDKENKVHVSVNLNPNFFNKGLGNKIIKKATEVFLREKPNIKGITAEVIEENTASKKSFEKANYQIVGGAEKKNRKIIIMTYRKEEN